MGNDSKPQRRSIRIPEYDYSQPGAYYITLLSKNRKPVFGTVDGDRVRLSIIGKIIREEWLATPYHRPYVELGVFAIMPDHFHAILNLIDQNEGTARRALTTVESFGAPVVGSLPTIVRAFKAAVTKRVNEYFKASEIIVWQRNYYEQVICSDCEYLNISAYIEFNPAAWSEENQK